MLLVGFNVHVAEAAAYSLVVAGALPRARKILHQIRNDEVEDPDPDWPEDAAGRVDRATKLLQATETDVAAALALLNGWRHDTLRSLHLGGDAADVLES